MSFGYTFFCESVKPLRDSLRTIAKNVHGNYTE